jgi:S1-C subfamily serine protease
MDAAERLIGVNTAINTPSGIFAGVEFAIPVDTFIRIGGEREQDCRCGAAHGLCHPGSITRKSCQTELFGHSLTKDGDGRRSPSSLAKVQPNGKLGVGARWISVGN